MAAAIIQTLSAFPKELVKTITCDRGSEFAGWQTIEKALNCDVYFTDPYCAWQKGSNENSNGLLREFYPKGRNLSRVSPKTLLRNLALINARPRKVLNFHSAQDLWIQELDNLLHFSWQFTDTRNGATHQRSTAIRSIFHFRPPFYFIWPNFRW